MAARAIELVEVVEAAIETARAAGGREASSAELGFGVAEVLARWGDEPDAALRRELDEVLAVIARLGDVVGVTDVGDAAGALNEMFELFAGPPRLVNEPGWGWHLHVDRPDAGWAGWLAASSAMALAALLSDRGRVPWGRCAAEGCDRPFLDHGRRAPQRFCSPPCATRERVRRHRSSS